MEPTRLQPQFQAATLSVQAQEVEELDDLKGQRVHAWVLVLAGKRMLEASLFLEPSTGLAYALEVLHTAHLLLTYCSPSA